MGILPDGSSWFCLQTRPHQEFIAQQNIERLKFKSLLPLTTKVRTVPRTGAKQEVKASLFGNYLFVAFDIATDNWRRLWNVYGVKRLFSSSPDRPTPIPTHSIMSLLSCSDDPVSSTPEIAKDCKVRIVSGPLVTLVDPVGICQWSDTQRIALLVKAMSGEIVVEFDRSAVELVAQPG